MKNTLFVAAFSLGLLPAMAQNALPVPDTLNGTTFNLTIHPDSANLLPGPITKTFAFNNAKYLGPTLIFQKGDSVSLNVLNQIGDTTSVHWHGLHVAPANDGGPHTPIMPGASWNPRFTVRNSAATFWYHPHFHGKTALHTMKGAAGLIIIRDAQEAALALPRTYGVDDVPLIVQAQQLDVNNQIDERGMVDSIVLVNGVMKPYKSVPAQVVRLRLLNAAGERNFNFGFTGNKSFSVIGNDAGLLPTPVSVTRIMLSPGERAEVLLDLTGMNGDSLYLMSYASEIPMGTQGGPTMPMPPGSPPMNSSLNGIDFNILKLKVTAPLAGGIMTVPATLVPQTPLVASGANTRRTINFTADSMMVMDGPFYFNDSSFDMMVVNYRIPLNSVEIWSLTNQTMVAHPFHIHDVSFWVLDIDGNPPPMAMRGMKDVVLVQPNQTVRFITKFETFADTMIPYMYHCHVLMHEDDGMMGQFVVTPQPLRVQDVAASATAFSVFPNPASDVVKLRFARSLEGKIHVTDVMGRRVYEGALNGITADFSTVGWNNGVYLITVTTAEATFSQRIVVQKP
jgi:bilirubin oxidase